MKTVAQVNCFGTKKLVFFNAIFIYANRDLFIKIFHLCANSVFFLSFKFN